MALTPLQQQALAHYRAQRARRPTLAEMLQSGRRRQVLSLSVAGMALAGLVWLGHPVLAALFGGVLLGVWLATIAQLQRFTEIWPVLDATLDWDRVEALAEGRSELPAGAGATPTPAPRSRLRWATGVGLLAAILLIGGLIGFDQGLAHYYDPRRGNPPQQVVILTTQWCGYCAALRRHLAANAIPYREIDTETSWEGQWAFRAVNARGVPVTVVGQDLAYGYARRDGGTSRIDELLTAAGYSLKTTIGAPVSSAASGR